MLFESFDRMPSDGTISLPEFLVAMAVNQVGTLNERLHLAFGILDRDNDGKVSREDLGVLLKSIFGLLQTVGIHPTSEPEAHIQWFTDYLFARLDRSFTGVHFSRQDYIEGAPALAQMIRSLGFADPNSPQAPPTTCRDSVAFGSPHFNAVINMMFGIRLCLGGGDRAGTDAVASTKLLPADFGRRASYTVHSTVAFSAFAPRVFSKFRRRFGVSDSVYIGALGPEQFFGNILLGNISTLSMKVSDGKSGSWFFTTHDERLFVKTISGSERRCLERNLQRIYSHIRQHPNSLINHIYGLYELDKTPFIVMGNLFYLPLSEGFTITTVYDLKGSTVGRSNTTGKGPKKDLDFMRELNVVRLGAFKRRMIIEQIRCDVQLLESIGVIDYSLLFGIVSKAPASGVGPPQEEFFFGIIDMLTSFRNIKKGGEFLMRSLIAGSETNFSCRPPGEYAARFVSFVESAFVA